MSFLMRLKPSVISRSAGIRLPTRRERGRQSKLPFLARAIRLLVFGLVFLHRVDAQTSIVIYRTNQEIVIGSDSKSTDHTVGTVNISSTRSKCKIRRIENTFISVAGIYDFDPYVEASNS